VTTAGRFPFPEMHFVTAFMLSRVGRYGESARELTAGLARAELLNDPTSVVWFHMLSATIALERGRLPDAERAARRALASADAIEDAGLRRVRAVYAMALAGIADARAGQLGEARSHLETLEKIHEPTARREAWPVGLLKAEIALAQNAPAEAAILFAAAEPATKMWFSAGEYVSVFANALSLRDGVARARQLQGDVSGAIEAYRFLTTIDLRQKWSAVLEPRFVLALARLLGRAGDRAGALREYQRFLELWSKADEPAPEVREARMALAPR
jgi:tetratricopeptide (TPR) repeat protein